MKRKLTELNINQTCEETDHYLHERNTDSKERIRTMLSLEETLLKYRKNFGSEGEYIVDSGSGFGRNRISLSV